MSRSRRYSGQRVEPHVGWGNSFLKVDRDAVECWLRYFGYPVAPVVTSAGEIWKEGVRELTESMEHYPPEV